MVMQSIHCSVTHPQKDGRHCPGVLKGISLPFSDPGPDFHLRAGPAVFGGWTPEEEHL